jgi:hypothetical protein
VHLWCLYVCISPSVQHIRTHDPVARSSAETTTRSFPLFSVKESCASVSPSGSARESINPECMQVAFQYSMLVYKKRHPSDAEGAEGERVYELQRRLRVLTIAPSVAKNAEQVYESLHVEPSLALLTHKALRLARRQSVAEARQLLQVRPAALYFRRRLSLFHPTS